MRAVVVGLVLMIAVSASVAIKEPPPPVSRWAGDSGSAGAPADVEYGRQFATVNIAGSVSYIRYLFEPKQAVILPDGGDYWFFFGYNDDQSNVETVVFEESQLWNPAAWIVMDVATWTGSGDLRYVSPTAYFDGAIWFPEVTWNAAAPTSDWYQLDEGGLGIGLWTAPLDVLGPTYDYYLPLTQAGPGNVIYMDGQARDVANDTHVFKSFSGWDGSIVDPPGEVVIFPDSVVYGQGYENSQLGCHNVTVVIAAGGYRSDQYTLPTNPLLMVYRMSTNGGLTWTDTTWVDQTLFPDMPGDYPGIDGHWSNSFFDGLIDMDGDLHGLALIVDYGCFNNTSYIHGLYDMHSEGGVMMSSLVCDGTYWITGDSLWDPRTEVLGGDTYMHSPSLAEGEDGTLFAAWADLGYYDGVTATHDIWISRSHDGGNTWLPAVKITETPNDDEYFPRLVPTTTDSFAYVLTMYNNLSGPMDMIQVPVDFEVVPVELASFTARPAEEGVLVAWETRSERDNLGFNVERSGSRAGAYRRLNGALIPGAGTTSEPQMYSYLDESTVPGQTYWYRLEDVSLSGERTPHGPVQVDVPGGAGLTLNVRAGADLVFLLQSTRSGEASLRLYDIRGRRVGTAWHGTVEKGMTQTVRMSSHVASGLYTAVLRQGDRNVRRRVGIVE